MNVSRQEPKCGELKAVVARQQQEIEGLRVRIADLEAADVGQLRDEVEKLRAAQAQSDQKIFQLQAGVAMTQGLVFLLGAGLLTTIGEELIKALNQYPNRLSNEQRQHVAEQLGDFGEKLVNAIRDLDIISQDTWEQFRPTLEARVQTLPPLKRALYQSFAEMARPSKIGTQFVELIAKMTELDSNIDLQGLKNLENLAVILDNVSNLWPLAAVNSLAPMLRFVGFDDAAEAAGEILDSLEQGVEIPRKLIHRIKPDLVAMDVIEERTKPTTIEEYLYHGFRLKQLGLSPDQAIAQGSIPSSAMQLKRANKAFRGLEELYDRVSEFPSPDMGYLDMMAELWRTAVANLKHPQDQSRLTASTRRSSGMGRGVVHSQD